MKKAQLGSIVKAIKPKKQMAGSYTPYTQPGGKPKAGGAKLTPTKTGSKTGFKKFIKKTGSKG